MPEQPKIYCIYNWRKPEQERSSAGHPLRMCKEDIVAIKAFGKIVSNYQKIKRIEDGAIIR